MNQKQLEERRAFKAAFRARLTLFAQRHRVDYEWMLTGNFRDLLRTVRRLAP